MSQAAWLMAAAPPPLAWATAPPEDEDDMLRIGDILTSTVDVDPGLPKPDGLGYGTWERWGHGRVVIGVDENEAGFEEAETEGGSATVTPAGSVSQPTFTGDAFSSVINHTHAVTITDGGHTHTQNAHNHAQDAHTHVQNSHSHTQDAHAHTLPVGATDDTAAPFDRADAGTNTSGANATTNTGSATATNQAATAVNQNATATNQAATAVNQSATTGISATTGNPAGGVASITPSGTVSQPTFTGQAQTVRMPFITAYLWKRVA